jgi:hypothetical protein
MDDTQTFYEDDFYFDDPYFEVYDDVIEGEIIDGEYFIENVEPFLPEVYPRGNLDGQTTGSGIRIDPLIFVVLLMSIFVGFNLLRDRGTFQVSAAPVGAARAVGGVRDTNSQEVNFGDPERVIFPYDHYTLTQGPHGFSYGHMAVDLSAGEGAEIKSPIYGEVTARYVDDLGNTVLEIENRFYKVTLLHGLYSVGVGERVRLGDPIGLESNQGNTYDMAGRSCRGRDCGYHTHLNIFDKRLGSNINPLDVMQAP